MYSTCAVVSYPIEYTMKGYMDLGAPMTKLVLSRSSLMIIVAQTLAEAMAIFIIHDYHDNPPFEDDREESDGQSSVTEVK